MVDEISSDLNGIKPDAIFCSVGGGGLLAGIILGCKKAGWDDGKRLASYCFCIFSKTKKKKKLFGLSTVLIGAFETIGADCFYQSIQANRQPPETRSSSTCASPRWISFYDPRHEVTLVRLNAITSVASSLGASSPAPGVVRMALDRAGPVRCALVPDSLSMHIAVKFAGNDETKNRFPPYIQAKELIKGF